MRLVILPGMDGGGALLAPFVAALPPWIHAEVVEYPPDVPLGYDALEARVRARLASSDEPTALLAESFSGPIAIRVAADPPAHLAALVLVATFATLPFPALARFAITRVAPHARQVPASRHLAALLITRLLFARPPPRAILRRTLLSPDSSSALVEALHAAIGRTSPAVLAHRIRAALEVDVRAELARVALPVLVLDARADRLLRPLGRETSARPPGPARRPRAVTVNAPHLVLESAPEESARLIAAFLGPLSSSGD